MVVVGLVALLAGMAGSAISDRSLKSENGALVRAEALPAPDDAIIDAVSRSSPAVVSIVASKDVPIIEREYISPFGNDPFFRQFFGEDFAIPQLRQRGSERRDVASGTGFIVSADGYIVTNKHVVSDTAADYTVFMNDGAKLAAKVVGRDPVEDLAILKVDRADLPTLKLGDSDQIKIGQTAIAIGNALGEFRNTVSVGVVSGLQRSITASGPGIGSEDLSELIQTDAAINPGNSGGPLLNLRGEVIGINTAIVQGANNIGFAIPANKAKKDIESVRRSGRIIATFMGVRYISLNDALAKQNNLPVSAGAWLHSGDAEPAVVAGSPAAKAGLQDGDIVVEIGGKKVDTEHSLSQLIQQYAVGDTVQVGFLRNGVRHTTSLMLVERP